MSCDDEVKCPSHLTQYVSTILKLNALRSKEISSLTVTTGESITNIKSNRSIYSSASDLLSLTLTLIDRNRGSWSSSRTTRSSKSDYSSPKSDYLILEAGLLRSGVGLHDPRCRTCWSPSRTTRSRCWSVAGLLDPPSRTTWVRCRTTATSRSQNSQYSTYINNATLEW